MGHILTASHTASNGYDLGRGPLRNEALGDEEKTGTLALLTTLDRSTLDPADGDAYHPIDLTTAADDAPGPSRRRQIPPSLNGFASPSTSSSRLFDEGSLNPDPTSSANSSNQSIKPGVSVVSALPEKPGTVERPEDRRLPLQQSLPMMPRRIKRPDVHLNLRISKKYSWMRESGSPESTSSRSSRSSKKSSSKHHLSPVKMSLRSSASQRRLRNLIDNQRLTAQISNMVAEDADVGHAGRRVMDLLRPNRNVATNKLRERRFRTR